MFVSLIEHKTQIQTKSDSDSDMFMNSFCGFGIFGAGWRGQHSQAHNILSHIIHTLFSTLKLPSQEYLLRYNRPLHIILHL
jgi:hypothetical protein